MAHLKLNTTQWLQLGKKLGYINDSGQVKEALFGNLFGKKEKEEEIHVYDLINKDELMSKIKEDILNSGEGRYDHAGTVFGAGRSYGFDIGVHGTEQGCYAKGKVHLTNQSTSISEEQIKNRIKNWAIDFAKIIIEEKGIDDKYHDELIDKIISTIEWPISRIVLNIKEKAVGEYYLRMGYFLDRQAGCDYAKGSSYPEKSAEKDIFDI